MKKRLSLRQVRAFQKTIWDFYRKYERKFPWRETNNPYSVLVSEVMLQQTHAERVVPFFKRFMQTFPTVQSLRRAPLCNVLRVWSGLGYNRRALYLQRAAEIIVSEYGGTVPRDEEKLHALPGIGRDTAAAILAFAWNESTVFIETNIRTVYLYFFFKNRRRVRDGEILKLIKKTLPVKVQPFSRFPPAPMLRRAGKVEPLGSREWYDALMDYGAYLKETVGNANRRSAHYTRQPRFRGSRRELRGEILRRAVQAGAVRSFDFAECMRNGIRVGAVLEELVREGFLKKRGEKFELAG